MVFENFEVYIYIHFLKKDNYFWDFLKSKYNYREFLFFLKIIFEIYNYIL
jgi:hypothetical protein